MALRKNQVDNRVADGVRAGYKIYWGRLMNMIQMKWKLKQTNWKSLEKKLVKLIKKKNKKLNKQDQIYLPRNWIEILKEHSEVPEITKVSIIFKDIGGKYPNMNARHNDYIVANLHWALKLLTERNGLVQDAYKSVIGHECAHYEVYYGDYKKDINSVIYNLRVAIIDRLIISIADYIIDILIRPINVLLYKKNIGAPYLALHMLTPRIRFYNYVNEIFADIRGMELLGISKKDAVELMRYRESFTKYPYKTYISHPSAQMRTQFVEIGEFDQNMIAVKVKCKNKKINKEIEKLYFGHTAKIKN